MRHDPAREPVALLAAPFVADWSLMVAPMLRTFWRLRWVTPRRLVRL